MAENNTIVTCAIDFDANGQDGPGFYYVMTDADGNESEAFGPHDTAEDAEKAFTAAMEMAAVETIKNFLGLDN